MLAFLAAAAVAAGAIFVAEFGDKSQLLILAFATRHAARPVIAGLVLAAAVIQGISVAIGAAIGTALPDTLVGVVAGVAFVAVGAWMLRGDDGEEDDEDEERAAAPTSRMAGPALVLAVAATFIVAELGDKTMLATFALAASQGPLPTWIGSTLGEVAANLVAVGVGRGIGVRLDPRGVRIGSAVLFVVAGMVVLVSALQP